MIKIYDVVVIGAGLAGLMTALRLSPLSVLVVSPTPLGQGSASDWAQGGIAAAIAENDSPTNHLEDTLICGSGLCNSEIVKQVVFQGADAIATLENLGMVFDKEPNGHYHFGQEGAHRYPRILSGGGDRTGHYILSALISAVRKADHIETCEETYLNGLLCKETNIIGCSLLHQNQIKTYQAAIVFASGGIGYLCQRTTNQKQHVVKD